jgi:prepilin-type N-terminal cleavage/methylation domain-containing protein/prepilin-type processing-associated H-X9-DG protein
MPVRASAHLPAHLRKGSPMHSDTSRRGVTLIELLVTISITTVLASLLLPAVQSARESGRRVSCMNNMAQVATAFIDYDGRHNILPGWRNAHPALRPGVRQSDPAFARVLDANTPSWPILLMPYLERLDVWKSWESATKTKPVPAAAPMIETLVCTSSPVVNGNLAQLAYVVNAGSCFVSPPTARRQYRSDGVFVDNVGEPPAGVSGASVYMASRMGLAAIASGDGAGNTLLVAEKSSSTVTQGSWNSVAPVARLTAAKTAQSIAVFNSASKTAVPVFGLTATLPKASEKVLNGFAGAPSSNHPGGVIVAFGDGHTRYLGDRIAAHVYAQLVTSRGEWVPQGSSGSYATNSLVGQRWLNLGPKPYVLSLSDYD